MSWQITINYNTPGNFTYDPTQIEVINSAKLKTLISPEETLYCEYASGIDGIRGSGTLTGTAFGGAGVAGGKLDLTGNASKYVQYVATGKTSIQSGAIRFKYTPNYVLPSSNVGIFAMNETSGLMQNSFSFWQLSGANVIYFHLVDKNNVTIENWTTLGFWSPTAGQEYEFEINWDFTTGFMKFFIDGVLFGSTTSVATMNEYTSFIVGNRILNDYNSDAKIDDLQIFNAVQHTADYTPQTPPQTIYPAGATYDSPVGSIFGVNFDTGIDAVFGSGSLTGTATGGATASGGKLDLTGNTSKYVEYVDGTNWDFGNVGTIRFKITPNWTGSNGIDQPFFHIADSANTGLNRIGLYLSGNSSLLLSMTNSSGTLLYHSSIGTWSPTSGQEYEFELNVDQTAGATRLFIDGVQFGATVTVTGTRDSNVNSFILGTAPSFAGGVANFKMDDVAIFNAVQHTANYTPGYTVQKFVGINPIIETNSSFLVDSLDKFSAIETKTGSDEIKYIIVFNGVDKYWNGSVWTNSDGTYAQANTATEIETNKASLDLSSGGSLKIKALFSSFDGSTTPELTSVTIDYGFYTTTPTALSKCIVWGVVQDLKGNVIQNVKVSAVQTDTSAVPVKNFQITGYTAIDTYTDANGYWEMDLIRSSQYTPNQKYNFKFQMPDGSLIEKLSLTIPDLDSQEFNSLI
jgi:hypothetical protein